MLEQDNPAARLYRLLKAGRTFSEDESCHSVWAKLLETDDEVILMARLAKVMALIHDAVLELRQVCPDQESSWSHWVVTVNRAFMSLNLRGSWAGFNGLIDNHTINYLRFAAEILQRNRAVKIPTRLDVEKCCADWKFLLIEINASREPFQVKYSLMKNARRLLIALEEYELTGAAVVLDAVKMAAGQVSIDFQYRSFIYQTDLGRKINEVLIKTADLVMSDVSPTQTNAASKNFFARDAGRMRHSFNSLMKFGFRLSRL